MARVSLQKTALELDFLVPTIICLAINLVVIVIIALAAAILPPQLPLFYGAPRGEDQLVPQSYLMIPPIIVTAITIINTILSKIIRDHFLQNVLFCFTLVATILSTVTLVRIILLVI